MAIRGRFPAYAPIVLLLTLVSTATAKYSGGTGEPNDPYQIARAADLIALGETPEDYDKHFLLTADIDLDPNLPGRKVFDEAVIAPWGRTPFTGHFDGDGHTISHLTINGRSYVGLFGRLEWGLTHEVKNLGVVDVNITGSACVGGLVGANGRIVTQCYSTGAVHGTEYVGGLVGGNGMGGLTHCHSTAAVSGDGWAVGGLVGQNAMGGLTHCYSTGAVDGNNVVGGLVGWSLEGVTQCYSTGAVSGNEDVGGLVGYNGGAVTQCYSTSTVAGNSSVGGLVGCNASTWWPGGGTTQGAVTDCYCTGMVSGNACVGGLVGAEESPWWVPGPIVTGSFWDIHASGQTASDGGIGKTTPEMQTAKTFLDAGWDFVGETANGAEDIWWILEGKGYPKLSWEGPAGMVFVDIPAGTFEMGDHDGVGWEDERPVHTVTLDGFQMGKYETTNAQYAHFLNAAMADGLIQVVDGRVYASSDESLTELYCHTYGSHGWSQIEYADGLFIVRSRDDKTMSDHPVNVVWWYGAKAFCDYYGYRLPTEAEWEYAARGGYHDPYYQYPWGSNTIDCTKANYYNGNSYCNPLNLTSMPYTSPVGYYGPQGAYGLCDMSGNVWEWCQDWRDEGYYSVSPESNPTGPTAGRFRVQRGGSWSSYDIGCRVANRSRFGPDNARISYIGFRVCR